MNNHKFLLFFSVLAMMASLLAIVSSATKVQAQFYCAGGVECLTKGEQCECEGGTKDGDSCGNGCPGGSCVCKQVVTGSTYEACRKSGSGCNAFCFEGTEGSNNCSAVYPPPQYVPPPPPPEEEPRTGYSCLAGAGCYSDSWGPYADYYSCALNCGPTGGSTGEHVEDWDDDCNKEGGKVDNSYDAFIWPGTTRVWETWAPPSGSTPEERMSHASPGKTTYTFTSPGDKITLGAGFKAGYVQNYVVENEDTETLYVYMGKNKLPMVFTDRSEIKAIAESEGYTVYPRDKFNENPFPRAPYGYPNPFGFIPFINCASALMADDHNVFRIDANGGTCTPYKFEDGKWVGDYAGYEHDAWYRRVWSEAEQRIVSWDDEIREVSHWYGQAYIQVPMTHFNWTTNTGEAKKNDFNVGWAWNRRDFGEESTVKESEICWIKQATWYQPIHYWTEIKQDPKCGDFSFFNRITSEIQNTANDAPIVLDQGTEYRVTVSGVNVHDYFEFYNQSFEDENIQTLYKVDGWQPAYGGRVPSGGIEKMEIVACGTNCPSSPGNVLRFARKKESINAFVNSNYIETRKNVSGKTFQIKFEARIDGNADTIRKVSNIALVRKKYVDLDETPVREIDSPEHYEQVLFNVNGREENTITLTNQWQTFVGKATFSDYPMGDPNYNDSSKIQIILRAPDNVSNNTTYIYYDNFELSTDPDPDKIELFYHPKTANYCASGNWLPKVDGVTKPFPLAEDSSTAVNAFDVTIPATSSPGTYILAANLYDDGSPVCTGNPSGTCGSVFPYAAESCNVEFQLQECINTPPELPNASVTSRTYCDLDGDETDDTFTVRVVPQGTSTTSLEVLVYKASEYGNPDSAYAEYVNTDDPGNIQKLVQTISESETYKDFTFNTKPDLSNNLVIAARSITSSCGDALKSDDWFVLNYQLKCPVSASISEVTNPNLCTGGITPNPGINGSVKVSWDSMDIGGGSRSSNISGNVANITSIPYLPSYTTGWNGNIWADLLINNTGLDEDEHYACASCNTGSSNYECRAQDPSQNVTSPGSAKFYVVKANLIYDSWWQTVGGLIFGNNSLSSAIPINDSGTPNANCGAKAWCKDHSFINAHPTVINPDLNDKQAGIPVTNDDAIITLNGSWWTNREPSDTGALGVGVPPATGTDRQDYDYFYKLLDLQTVTPRSGDEARFNNSSTPNSPITPFNDGETTKTVYVHYLRPATRGSSGTVDLIVGDYSNPWNIDTNSKYILVIDGNLRVRQPNTRLTMAGKNSIDIASGGFLMVVASGDITFDKNIGYDCGSDPAGLTCLDTNNSKMITADRGQLIEGIFIASDNLTIESYDTSGTATMNRKFVAGGTFVGWNGVNLPRKFENNTTTDPLARQKNAVSPTEQFFFRPDLVANTPEAIKTPDLTWKEAN